MKDIINFLSYRFPKWSVLKALHLRCNELIPSYSRQGISLLKLWWKVNVLNIWNILYIPSEQLLPYGIIIFKKEGHLATIIHHYLVDNKEATNTIQNVLDNYLAKMSIEQITQVAIVLPKYLTPDFENYEENIILLQKQKDFFINELGFEVDTVYQYMSHISRTYKHGDILLVRNLK